MHWLKALGVFLMGNLIIYKIFSFTVLIFGWTFEHHKHHNVTPEVTAVYKKPLHQQTDRQTENLTEDLTEDSSPGTEAGLSFGSVV